ncbi:DNA-3-methyladenine glycosylase 2 family protein [Oleiagrimonas soli]|uniref:DNA-3-methyladenine glycosylase II n=1 Tax=Oleiagrimonas soli TaxID=1543381 RepID=A0A099CYR1_9GAMM|nr:DNA-3-methyladenine glycosylase 2 [Oleiagrimonas soli]KGI78816.1 DNA methylase [Oleiagrimonas soli]MBB6184403.1 AraC family transcriptional regulator of adaptative response / DNA-3-methyladenine glycosylase II [Oleiagrimonas soli]
MDTVVALPNVPDAQVCEQARLSRDARFDGLFFTAVRSTGIYCRPVCPAPTPKPQHVTYYATAAAAAAAGYRPCLRCRPELAPGAWAWRSGNELVAGALRMIEDGLLDHAPVATLAERTGLSERHLRRLFADTLGASPLQVAATRRLLFARKLLDETALPITQIALGAGYGSVRRFNAAFLDSFGVPPREMRRRRVAAETQGVRLRLGYRPPYDFPAMLAFLSARAVPGIERVTGDAYERVFRLQGHAGRLRVQALDGEPALQLHVEHPRADVLTDVVARVRRLFDLDAEPQAIALGLAGDPLLKRLLRAQPGIRVPGCWDGFEIAVRAVLGQQVSVAAARTLASRIVDRWGEPLGMEVDDDAPAHAFPAPGVLAEAALEEVGVMGQRARTIRAMAAAVAAGEVDFRAERGLDAFVAMWTALPGIGPWTAHYIALRALGHPDAFPAADLILRRRAGGGRTLSTRELETRGMAWRPWRAYATLLLWRCEE